MGIARIFAKWIVCGAASLAGCGLAPRIDSATDALVAAATVDGAGVWIHLLEPYAPERIPVLFVHGIGGSPRDFDAIVGKLDRTRFQAWMLRYPTDTRLHEAAHAMGRALAELERRHRFRDLFIVAHSMGGLVSRRYLLDVSQEPGGGVAHLLVTFSTPWAGNNWARVGARLVPHSSDSAIALQSQIPGWIQLEAERCWGFDADHTGILSHETALNRLSALLESAADQARSGRNGGTTLH